MEKPQIYSHFTWDASTFTKTTHHIYACGNTGHNLKVTKLLLDNQSDISVMKLELLKETQPAERPL